MTALCSACHNNNLTAAQVLLKSGSRVNIADAKKSLPLHYAARNGNVTLVKTLLKHGTSDRAWFSRIPQRWRARQVHLTLLWMESMEWDQTCCGQHF